MIELREPLVGSISKSLAFIIDETCIVMNSL